MDDSIAQRVMAMLQQFKNQPTGPLVPMSAGGAPMPFPAQPSRLPINGARVPHTPAPNTLVPPWVGVRN